jgi:DNA-binding IclR family transcriptional regulator
MRSLLTPFCGTPNSQPVLTIVDQEKLRRDLARVRRQGFAESEGEITPGARSVGVPVRGPADTQAEGLILGHSVFFDVFRFEDGMIVEGTVNLSKRGVEGAT